MYSASPLVCVPWIQGDNMGIKTKSITPAPMLKVSEWVWIRGIQMDRSCFRCSTRLTNAGYFGYGAGGKQQDLC